MTGGSRGTGAAIVKRLAGEGAHVALTYLSKPATPMRRNDAQPGPKNDQRRDLLGGAVARQRQQLSERVGEVAAAPYLAGPEVGFVS